MVADGLPAGELRKDGVDAGMRGDADVRAAREENVVATWTTTPRTVDAPGRRPSWRTEAADPGDDAR